MSRRFGLVVVDLRHALISRGRNICDVTTQQESIVVKAPLKLDEKKNAVQTASEKKKGGDRIPCR